MAWLDRFWRSTRDPSRGWRRSANLALEVALDQHTLDGLAPGDDVERWSGLGPAHGSRLAARGLLAYRDLGLVVGWDPERRVVTDFTLLYAAQPEGPFGVDAPFAGVVRHAGHLLRLSARVSAEEVLEALGPPAWRDASPEDPAEITLYYHHESPRGAVEWQLAWGDEGFEDVVVTEGHSAPPRPR